MKLFYTLAFFLLSLSLYGQETSHRIPLSAPLPRDPLARDGARVQTTCTADTVMYPYLKEVVFSAPNDSFFVDAMVGNVRTASQGYPNNQSVSVKGVKFWAGAYTINPNSTKLTSVAVTLYSVDAQFMPLTELATSVIDIPTTYDFYRVLFSSPVTVSGNYAVSIRCVLNDTLGAITNNAGSEFNPKNYGEGLAWRKFGSGAWNTTASFFGQDMEYMIFPIVDYSITSSYSTPAPASAGYVQPFTNTSSPVLMSRVYNLTAFDTYWGLQPTDQAFTWDYGDGATEVKKDGLHTYAAPGNYNVKLSSTLTGYYTSCLDEVVTILQVNSNKIDTVLYPYYKELAFSAPKDSFFVDAMVGNVRTASQAYGNSQPMTIKGVKFWGAGYTINPASTKTTSVAVSVWSVDANNQPVTELATTVVNISTAYAWYDASFAAPPNVTGNYAVSVRSHVYDTLGIITNNAGSEFNPKDYGEGLAWRRFGSGAWNTTQSFFGQDMEYMIFPVISYQPVGSFNNDGLAHPHVPESFGNTSSPALSSRFYNLTAFDKYWGLAPIDPTFSWNYGDGTAAHVAKDGIHTYTTLGSYNVGMTGSLRGYHANAHYTVISTTPITVSAALPARLGSFTGQKQGTANLLKWHALTEESLAYYSIERSSDASTYETVATVTAQNRNGADYSWADRQPAARTYYRLRIVNRDSSASYSGVVMLARSGLPFAVKVVSGGNGVHLNITSEKAERMIVSVYSAAGVLLSQQTHNIQQGSNSLPVPALNGAAKGIYFIHVDSGSGRETIRWVQ